MSKYVTYFRTFGKYYYLLSILVKRDVKKKYKGSFLGMLWSLINPLLNMVVLTIVFSTVFKTSLKNFPVYLLTGQLLFGFYSDSTMASMNSIISSAQLINKVYVPKYMLTLSPIISNFIFFLISLVDLILIMVATKSTINENIFYAPIYLFLLFVCSCGISLMLATATVFFRDVEHLYGVIVTILMYASAIFYPINIIPDKYRFILDLNPILYFITGFREVVYEGIPIQMHNLLICLVISLTSMIAGVLVFEKNQSKFILHV